MEKTGIKLQTIKLSMIIGLFIFIILTISVELHLHFLQRIDLWTFDWCLKYFGEPQMNFTSGWLTSYLTFFARYFDIITVVGLTIITASIFAWRKYYAIAVWLLVVVASGGILGILFKDIIHRPRPYDHLLIDSGFSFPSGHSLASSLWFIIVIFILLPHTKKKYRVYAYIIGILSIICWLSILVSRLYFHAHFFTDVIGGVALSVFWVMASVFFYSYWIEPNVTKFFPKNKHFQMMKQ